MKLRNTADAIVFAQRFESSLDKQIHFARAKRELRVREFLANANVEAKKDFLKTLFDLNRMLLKYAAISESLHLYFDNSVLQDVLQQDSGRMPGRFHALLAFLMLIEDYYCLDIFACVSPAVLYEASGLGARPPQTAEAEIRSAMSEIGLVTQPVGYSSFGELRVLFRKIRHDEKTIHNALKEIRHTSWSRDFVGDFPGSTRLPLSIAEEECPPVQLAYFHPWYVKFVLMHAIQNRLFEENKNKRIRRMMANSQKKKISFLKIESNRLKGLADLELFSYCELTAQSLAHSPTTVMGITVDTELTNALMWRQHLIPPISGDLGVDELGDFFQRVSYWQQVNDRRLQKANRRLTEYASALQLFIDRFRDYLIDAGK